MSFGLSSYGAGSWGGATFFLTSQVPTDNSTGNFRLPVISFLLSSNNGKVILNSINVLANGVPLIISGIFQGANVGTIDDTDINNVQVAIQVGHAYQQLSNVSVVVSALNINNESLAYGDSWQFTVDANIFLFANYIVRSYQRIFNVGPTGPLSEPLNVRAIVELAAPQNIIIVEI